MPDELTPLTGAQRDNIRENLRIAPGLRSPQWWYKTSTRLLADLERAEAEAKRNRNEALDALQKLGIAVNQTTQAEAEIKGLQRERGIMKSRAEKADAEIERLSAELEEVGPAKDEYVLVADQRRKLWEAEKAEVTRLRELLVTQRRELGAAHDETAAELKRVREAARTEIERLEQSARQWQEVCEEAARKALIERAQSTARERTLQAIRQSALDAGCVEIEVCLGCGTPTAAERDCGCPCGTSKRLSNARAEKAEAALAEARAWADQLQTTRDLAVVHHLALEVLAKAREEGRQQGHAEVSQAREARTFEQQRPDIPEVRS